MLRGGHYFILACSLPALILLGPAIGYAQDKNSGIHVPEGVYIKLTKEFYEALKDEGSKGAEVYTNDPSTEYLKQISISARFMVETNLLILRQQERLIQLLHSFLEQKKK